MKSKVYNNTILINHYIHVVELLFLRFRHVRNIHSSVGNVGQSMSVQPLLPIGENTLGK